MRDSLTLPPPPTPHAASPQLMGPQLDVTWAKRVKAILGCQSGWAFWNSSSQIIDILSLLEFLRPTNALRREKPFSKIHPGHGSQNESNACAWITCVTWGTCTWRFTTNKVTWVARYSSRQFQETDRLESSVGRQGQRYVAGKLFFRDGNGTSYLQMGLSEKTSQGEISVSCATSKHKHASRLHGNPCSFKYRLYSDLFIICFPLSLFLAGTRLFIRIHFVRISRLKFAQF